MKGAPFASMRTQQSDIALILWNTDVIEFVSVVLLRDNVRCCGIQPDEAEDRIEEFIASHGSNTVMFDLAPPYSQSAKVFMRLIDRFPDRSFIITCADPMLAIKVAPWLSCHHIVQKPYEAEEIRDILLSTMSRIPKHVLQALSPQPS